jgi:hypothetical protein
MCQIISTEVRHIIRKTTARSMLIFPSEIQSESPSFASYAEAGYGIETLLIAQDGSCLLMEFPRCRRDGIGTFKAVARISKVGEGMGAGIEFLPDGEINLIGLVVAGSEILEICRLIQYMCDAQSRPRSKVQRSWPSPRATALACIAIPALRELRTS